MLVCGFAASLAGCAHLPPPPPMTQQLPAAWHNAEHARDARPPLDLTRWWQGFGDPTLNRLVRQAAAQNLTLQQAASRVEEVRADQQAARSGLLPEVVAGATVQGERLFGNNRLGNVALSTGVPGVSATAQPLVIGRRSFAYYEPGLDAAWELPLFGREAATRTLTEGAVGSAVAGEAAAKVRLVAEVARSYIGLRADQERQALLTASLAAARRLADLVEVRLHAELANDLEVARARTEADRIATRLAPLEGAIRAATQHLAMLCGEPEPDPTLSVPAPMPAPPTASLNVVPADLLRLRPDIAQAEQNVAENAGELGIAVANLYPRFTLVGSIGAVGSLSGAMTGVTGLFSGGPAVTIPLLDWGARLDQAKARNAALAGSILRYREAVLSSIADTEAALAQVAAARREASAARQQVASAARAAHAARILYSRGLTPLSDRLDAERASLDAQLEVAAAVRSEALAAIALYKAIGGATPGDPGA
ncbi:MAG TPA: efflux transporter outer membrane subunit [Acetobacteraceae bacterium]|nr:efflux transporter outer membrane subunit [Acetobacteraceae bacterium]